MLNLDEDLNAGMGIVPIDYKETFVTPSVRLNLFPMTGVSPWVSFGGGFGHFSENQNLIFGAGTNPGSRLQSGVIQGGLGLDVKVWHVSVSAAKGGISGRDILISLWPTPGRRDSITISSVREWSGASSRAIRITAGKHFVAIFLAAPTPKTDPPEIVDHARRNMLLDHFAAALLLAFQGSDSTPQQATSDYERYRQAAIHINKLAGSIHTEADAKAFVDTIAEQFAGDRGLSWITLGIRHRVARAEHAAVSDRSRLIPEERIVNVWNEYVRELNAPEEALVTVAEMHNLRDAMYTSARMFSEKDLPGRCGQCLMSTLLMTRVKFSTVAVDGSSQNPS